MMSLLSESLKSSYSKKLYYSISEVSKQVALEPHVLRYWESEFSKLRPKKSRSGNRRYKERDIDIIRYIKHLLQEEMYTVQGVKKRLMGSDIESIRGQLNLLSTLPSQQKTSGEDSKMNRELISTIITELREIKDSLDQ